MADYTQEQFEKFKTLVLLQESRDQLSRIRGRMAMSKFVEETGRAVCDAMFKAIGDPKNIDQFSLKKPCRHCPFSPGKDAIKFQTRERAQGVLESAYRNGFPCHKSGLNTEDLEDECDGGYVFGPDTQHCAGALMMFAKGGNDEGWPGIDNSEEQAEKIHERMDWKAPHFECEHDYLEFHAPKKTRKRRKSA